MRSNEMSRCVLAVAAVVGVPAMGFAQTGQGSHANKIFLSEDGDWMLGSNWSHTVSDVSYVPGSRLDFYNDAFINLNRIATLAVDASVYGNQLRGITVGSGSNGRLNITADGNLVGYGGVAIGGGAGEGQVDVHGKMVVSSIALNAGWLDVNVGAQVDLGAQHAFNINDGTVNFSGGTITDVSSNNSGGWRISGGTVNHSGGSSWMNRDLEIGRDGRTAVYNLSGTGLTNFTHLDVGRGGTGTLNISGGTLDVRGSIYISTREPNVVNSGTLVVSGGLVKTKNVTRVGNPTSLGTATFRVVGNQGTITLDNGINNGFGGPIPENANAPLFVWENGTLNFVIGADGISPINIVSHAPADSRSVSYLMGTLDLDLMNGFVPTVGDTFDLVTTNVTASRDGVVGMGITGLDLAAADQPFWSFEVVVDGNTRILRATNVAPIPEPAGLALLGLAVPALLRRRGGA